MAYDDEAFEEAMAKVQDGLGEIERLFEGTKLTRTIDAKWGPLNGVADCS